MIKKMVRAFTIFFLAMCVRQLLRLRYRIKVKGWEEVKHYPFDTKKGILFLPNHPAEIDPVIIETFIFERFAPKPLIVEHFHRLKGFRILLDFIGVLPLPTMDEKANKWRAKRVEKQFEQLVTKVNSGENLLIYPSGRLKKTSEESLGGASLTHRLVQACPGVQIVLIRTTGLWGSQFSRALTSHSPNFGAVLGNCIKILLKNGFFFAPKREVLVEFEVAKEDLPRNAPRLEFNRYLERWYNSSSDVIRLIPDLFWDHTLPCVATIESCSEDQKHKKNVPPELLKEVLAFLSALSKKPPEEIGREDRLAHDLGLDSLDLVQLFVFLDEKYGRRDILGGSLHTVEDVLQAALGNGREAPEEVHVDLPPFVWVKEKRDFPCIPEGETVQEVFLRSSRAGGSRIACVDDLIGVMTYRQFILRALLFAEKIRPLEDHRIGIMLPSSSAAYLVIVGVLLAGKVPVMLNWTAGARVLDHSVQLTEVNQVITSMRFLDRLENEDLGQVEDKFLFVEDIKETFSLKDKLKAFYLQFLSVRALLKKLHLNTLSSSDPAVILFTSGTEALPKGVPLSHQNLLSNQRSALSVAGLRSEDILYGVLPPFHSFGFSVTGLLPLLCGIRVCYAPDPTDSHGLAKDIARYRATLFLCAPSFIKALFRIAAVEQLTFLRLIVSGAEKTPQDLFDYVHKNLPKTRLLEGYGITECSPIVTLDREAESHLGVGKPMPGVNLLIVDPETGQPLPTGQQGEIYISGPNVFEGYINGHAKSPFVTIGSHKWYVSGDRGSLTEGGNLILSGRTKRFIKVGGEMINLSGLEEELLRLAQENRWISNQEGPSLALSFRGNEGDRPVLVLFTTLSVSLEEVNRGLKEAGFGRIVKVAQVYQMKEIPLMGTGKTNYRLLEELDRKEMYGNTEFKTL